MPLRKKIPKFKDLCIDNILRNIVIHGELLKTHRDRGNEEISGPYRTLKLLYSDVLLQRLFDLLFQESTDEILRVLQDVMFKSEEKQPECKYWPCLEMFFNEYTSVILPQRDLKLKYELQDFHKVRDIFRCFMQEGLYDAIPRFQNLREVNLAYPADSEVFKKILEACPLITYLSVKVCDTDLIFLSLCKHHSFQERFTFCPENGECSKAGKHLEHLHVDLNGTTTFAAGIACALQHLPLLRSFYPLPFKPVPFRPVCILPEVFKGIHTLQKAAIHRGKEQVTLKLSTLFFDRYLNPRELRNVLVSCPNLEAIQVNLLGVNPQIFTLGSFKNLKELILSAVGNETLHSTELKHLLSAKGKEIEAISFHGSDCLDLVLINNILHSCVNLKRLSIDYIQIQDRNYNDITRMPSCIAKLEDLFLGVNRHDYTTSPRCQGYFCDLLSNAKNLTRLTIASNFSEQVFLNSLDKTGFQCLQELIILSRKAADFPYLRLLDGKNSLRLLKFWCRRTSPNVARCIQFARHNNYEVEFLEAMDNL